MNNGCDKPALTTFDPNVPFADKADLGSQSLKVRFQFHHLVS